ncbi:MAG: choline kinase family protein [Acidimicrobiales bacterium]
MSLDELLDRVPGWAGRDRTVEPLDGGITNRNYRVTLDGESFVVRAPGEHTNQLGIDRRHEEEASRQAAALGVAPEVVAFIEPEGSLVTRFITGSAIAPDALGAAPLLGAAAALLRVVHRGPALAAVFDWYRVPQAYAATARARGGAVPAAYGPAIDVAGRVRAAFAASPEASCPCHNDLLAANFLRSTDGLRLVDWEYAGMNDRYFDLGNFAVNNGLDPAGEAALVEAYFGDVTARRLARLRLMMVISDLREAMWGVVQASLSSLDFDFIGYAGDHFDRFAERAGRPGFGRLLEEAATDA